MSRAPVVSIGCFGFLFAGCAADPGVRSFEPTPELSCAGKPVVLAWTVVGRAALQANPEPAGWQGPEIPSEGTRTVTPAVDTAFTITALDVPLGHGRAVGTRHVRIKPQNDNRGASTECDATHCTAKLDVTGGGSIRVERLTDPTMLKDGKVHPRKVCVTPPGGQRSCLEPGQTLVLGVPVGGPWTLDTDLAPGETEDPPHQLRIRFDFGCP